MARSVDQPVAGKLFLQALRCDRSALVVVFRLLLCRPPSAGAGDRRRPVGYLLKLVTTGRRVQVALTAAARERQRQKGERANQNKANQCVLRPRQSGLRNFA